MAKQTALSSMTGFARGHGVVGSYAWAWELKSVNAKGLDVRLRLPPGWDAIEAPVRARANEALVRGTVYANLTIDRKGVGVAVKVNEPVLAAVLATLKTISSRVEASPPTLDGIMALKGVIEVTEEDEREEDRRAGEVGRRAKNLPKVAAVGPGTAEQLRSQGIEPDFVPKVSSVDGLLAEFPRPEGKIVYLAAENARRRPIDALRKEKERVLDAALGTEPP